jgi:hypothetical protein
MEFRPTMLTAVIITAAFIMGVIVGGIGCFFFVDDTASASQTDPGGFAEHEDFEVPANAERELA